MVNKSLVGFVFGASFVGALVFVSTTNRGLAMKPNPTNRMESLFQATKTICVGRFVMEIPTESEVIYGPTRLPYLIELRSSSVEELAAALEERLKEINTDDRLRARGPLMKPDSVFGTVLNGFVENQKIVFGAAKSPGSFYSIESYQMVGQNIYVQSTTAYGDDYKEAVAQLNVIAPLMHPRSEDEIPSVPGICLEGAFINEPLSPMYEAISLGVRLRKFPDVLFSIEMIKKDRRVEGDSLEARAEAAETDARRSGAGRWFDQVSIFRRGERRIGGWIGSEFLARKPMIGKVHESHEFAFFSHGEPGNPMVPTLDIELNTGVNDGKAGGMQTSISDEEALYLWDKITTSIRPRSVVDLKHGNLRPGQ
jgi:hypothetical protein